MESIPLLNGEHEARVYLCELAQRSGGASMNPVRKAFLAPSSRKTT